MLRVKERWGAWKPYVVPSLVFLVIVLAMFWRLWTPIAEARRTFGWDAQWEYWGDLQFQVDAYGAGELPLWNPFDRLGYPLHADPQAGVLYPVTWLLCGLSGLAGGTPWWTIAVKIAIHFWLAALGVYAFLRRRGTPVPACYAGGLVFILTYPYVHNLFSALNWGMAWAPWMLLAVDHFAEKPTLGRGAALSLAAGMAWLAGAPGAFWYGFLVVVPYGIWALLHHGTFRKALVPLGVSALLFAAMVAAQFSATGGLVAESVREQRNLEFIGTTAFTADDVVAFFIPRYPAGGENTYLGMIAVIGTTVALTLKPSARALVLAGSAMVGILCAWGNIGLFLPIEASVIPPFGFFRRAHRYLYVTVLPLSILGAEGLVALAELEGEALKQRLANLLLILGIVGALLWGTGFILKAAEAGKLEPWRDAYACAFASTLVAAFLCRQIVTQEAPRWRHAFFVIAVVALGLDLWFSRSFVVDRNMYPIPATPRDGEARRIAGVPLEARVYDREYLKFRPGIRLHIRDLGGYEGDPLALRRYARLLDAAKRTPRALAHLNVRWLLDAHPSQPLPRDPSLRLERQGVYEVPEAAPAVLWVDRATVVDGEEAAAKALVGGAPGKLAILERGSLAPGEEQAAVAGDAAAAPVAGRIVELSRNRLVAEVDAPADGVVVIHEAWFPGRWEATVDGAAARILPANAAFRGLLVGPGHHRIEMRYRAGGYLTLAVVELVALAGALFLVFWSRRREG